MLSSFVVLAILSSPTLEVFAPGWNPEWQSVPFGGAVIFDGGPDSTLTFAPHGEYETLGIYRFNKWSWTEGQYRVLPGPGTPAGTLVPVRMSFTVEYVVQVSAVENLLLDGVINYSSRFGELEGPTGSLPFSGPFAQILTHEVSRVEWIPADGEWRYGDAAILPFYGEIGLVHSVLIDPSLPGSFDLQYGAYLSGRVEILPVPEPATVALVGIGLAFFCRRRSSTT